MFVFEGPDIKSWRSYDGPLLLMIRMETMESLRDRQEALRTPPTAASPPINLTLETAHYQLYRFRGYSFYVREGRQPPPDWQVAEALGLRP